VAAQDAAARRLERDLHDGAQQQLVAIAVTARLARAVAGRDPERAEGLLVELGSMAQEALETIRDLARGVYPPLLAEAGLAVALDAQVRKASIPASIEASDVGRYPSETEASVYFCCLEAFQNIRKYAHATRIEVHLEGSPERLDFRVADDGDGFDTARTPRGSGLQNMADRLAALGGSLTVRSEPGGGTVISGSVPATAAAVVAASPNGDDRLPSRGGPGTNGGEPAMGGSR
jgi:signal transduction histidine kinase